jgi:hypothetical protein
MFSDRRRAVTTTTLPCPSLSAAASWTRCVAWAQATAGVATTEALANSARMRSGRVIEDPLFCICRIPIDSIEIGTETNPH